MHLLPSILRLRPTVVFGETLSSGPTLKTPATRRSRSLTENRAGRLATWFRPESFSILELYPAGDPRNVRNAYEASPFPSTHNGAAAPYSLVPCLNRPRRRPRPFFRWYEPNSRCLLSPFILLPSCKQSRSPSEDEDEKDWDGTLNRYAAPCHLRSSCALTSCAWQLPPSRDRSGGSQDAGFLRRVQHLLFSSGADRGF
jgi:hypothetical protein